MVIVITDKKNSKKNLESQSLQFSCKLGGPQFCISKILDETWYEMVWNHGFLAPNYWWNHKWLVEGKIYRKRPYSMGKSMVSGFDFSFSQSIETMVPPSNLGVSDWQSPPGCSFCLGTKVAGNAIFESCWESECGNLKSSTICVVYNVL